MAMQNIGDAIDNVIDQLELIPAFATYTFYDTLTVRNFTFPAVILNAISTPLQNFGGGTAAPIEFYINIIIVNTVGASTNIHTVQGAIETLMVESVLPAICGEAIEQINHYESTHGAKNVVVSSLAIKIPRR